ncbi:pyocin knob domain-containing protein [Paenibacillus sp. FA6]|uniref:pyocin knob domain-containing protein n=1 Tax=Paenibacillus sp. FA6 TaxID=3413029 RepID=UPI003F65D0A1
MAFNKQAPEWGAIGIEPPESKRIAGWEVEDRPPAAWLNWFMNLTAESLQELQEKAAEKTYVDEKIAEAIPDDASLTVKGITQLNSAVDSTSETESATPKAVKIVNDTLTTHTAEDATLTTKGHVQLSNATDGIREDVAATEKAVGLLHNELSNDSQLSAVLKDGTQVIQGGQAPAIAFPKIEGRTLINMYGDAGSCENAEKLNVNGLYQGATASLDAVNKVSGNYGAKVTIQTGFPTRGSTAGAYFDFLAGRKYLLAGYVKNGNATSVNLTAPNVGGIHTPVVTDTTKFNFIYKKFAVATTIQSYLSIGVSGAPGQYAYADNIRLYELSEAEYIAIDTMTAEQVSAKYPYVGTGIHGIKDVTITSAQDNLLPPFSEWIRIHHNATIVSAYGLKHIKTVTSTAESSSSKNIPVESDTTYTVNSGGGSFVVYGSRDGITYGILQNVFTGTKTITVDATTKFLMIEAYITDLITGVMAWTNPMLIKGETDKPFKPQSKTSLTAYTELHSNINGTVKDLLEYVSGKPKKVKRWEKAVLDGSLSWILSLALPGASHKVFRAQAPNSHSFSGVVTKFNGAVLTTIAPGTWSAEDQTVLAVDGYLYLSVSNAESGWGDAYTPTAEEVKAYFNGWRMAENSNWGAPYNGTGTKAWGRIDSSGGLISSSGVLTVPTMLNDQGGYTPYELLYQLASPIIEDIQISGTVVLESGGNYVTVNSTNVPINPSTITYANSFYSALRDIERSFSVNNGLFGGMKPENFIFGDSSRGSTSWVRGVNNIKKSGSYYVTHNFDGLPYSTNGYIDHNQTPTSDDFAKQVFTPYESDKKYFRRQLSGIWGPWVEIWTTVNNPASLAANGYQRLASGLIIQWGTVGVPIGGLTITFPVSFPNNILHVNGMAVDSEATVVTYTGVTLHAVAIKHSEQTGPRNITWFAIGV